MAGGYKRCQSGRVSADGRRCCTNGREMVCRVSVGSDCSLIISLHICPMVQSEWAACVYSRILHRSGLVPPMMDEECERVCIRAKSADAITPQKLSKTLVVHRHPHYANGGLLLLKPCYSSARMEPPGQQSVVDAYLTIARCGNASISKFSPSERQSGSNGPIQFGRNNSHVTQFGIDDCCGFLKSDITLGNQDCHGSAMHVSVQMSSAPEVLNDLLYRHRSIVESEPGHHHIMTCNPSWSSGCATIEPVSTLPIKCLRLPIFCSQPCTRTTTTAAAAQAVGSCRLSGSTRQCSSSPAQTR
jgi:hypothetical protein